MNTLGSGPLRAEPAPGSRDPWADAELAAVLLAVYPQGLGGVRLRGAPDERRAHWLQALRSACTAGTPWQRLPLHTDDDRLLGGLDLGATLQRGTVVLQPGLLARTDGGVLLVAMAERMSPGLAARVASALDSGCVVTHQAGQAATAPARLMVVALDEGGDDSPAAQASDAATTAAGAGVGVAADLQGEVPPAALLERLGFSIRLMDLPRPDADRVAACSAPAVQQARAAAVAAARQRLPAVRCSDAMVQALCEAALVLGVPSLRASLFAVAAARAHAALQGRDEVTVEDASLAARLVLAPRATRLPQQPPESTEDEQPPPAAEPPTTETAPPDQPEAESTPPAQDPSEPASPAEAEPEQPPQPPTAEDGAPQDQVLQSALAAVPPGLLALLATAAGRSPAGAGGRAGALQASRLRGRPYGSRRGDPRAGARLHLIDTLRAAAPWQLLRRREVALRAGAAPAAAAGHALAAKGLSTSASAGPAVHVRREDFHITRFRQRRETTTLFVVDASGSAALHRLAEAKGAVELLLADCYVRRDRVALLAFRGSVGAELLLPPTRSLVRAKRSLAGMAGGGGTPLAAALDAARDLTQGIARQGGTALAVFLTDGRANIARDGSPGRERAHADAMASARLWCASGLGALWLDTAPQPQAAAQQIALAMGARYLPLPHADAQQVSRAVTALR